MRQDSSQMGKEALVKGKRTFRLDGPEQAIKGARVEVSSLVVHATHDSIRRVHDAAYNESRAGRRHEMQSRTLLHTNVFYKLALSEEVCWELDTGSETSSDHGRYNATIQTLDSLGAVDLGEAIGGAFILMLCTNG
jgi:hypothetical protein